MFYLLIYLISMEDFSQTNQKIKTVRLNYSLNNFAIDI